MKERITFYDSLKFILIFFVIVGHVIGRYIDENDNIKSLFYFIYLFHMPMFVFVSGYFHKSYDWKSCKKSVLKILETYVFFQLIWIVINRDFSLSALLVPSWTLWYLLSLIFWKIFANYLVPKVNKYILFFVVFCISIIWGG